MINKTRFGGGLKVFRLFFPKENRSFIGKRWLKITLRTIHLIGIAGLGGAYLYKASLDLCLPYLHLSVISGLFLFLLDIWSNGICLIQLKGAAIMIKLVLFFALMKYHGWDIFLFSAIMIISGVISHAPGKVRYFSIAHGKVIHIWD